MRTLAAALLLLGGCTSTPPGPRVVLGLQSSLGVQRLEVVVLVDGAPRAGGGVWAVSEGSLEFPRELDVPDLPTGGALSLDVRAFDEDLSAPLVARRWLLDVPASGDWLARVRLEKECVPFQQLPGGQNAPACEGELTCVAAACVDPHTGELEPYRPDWAVDYADACKPEGSTPTVEIGTGEDTWSPLLPGGDLDLVLGPQGGYHLWLAVRAGGLHQSGSLTSLRIAAEDGSLDLGEQTWSNALVPDGDACRLVGLQYVTPAEYWSFEGIQALLSLPVRVDARVVDERGDVALATAHGVLR